MYATRLLIVGFALSAVGAGGGLAAYDARLDATVVPGPSAGESEHVSLQSPSTCSFFFTSGTGDQFLKYCVTANGNITQLETPAGAEHVRVGLVGEGYGFCDFSSGAAYYDYAEFGDTPNWGLATLVSQSPTTVVIARTTSDGLWTLTQTFTQSASTSSVIVSMALKNNSTIDRHVSLIRFVDVDAHGVALNTLGNTFNSVFAWVPYPSPNNLDRRGLIMQNAVSGFPMHGGTTFRTDGFRHPPDPCPNFLLFGPSDTLTEVDGAMFMQFKSDVPKARTVTVRVSYKGL